MNAYTATRQHDDLSSAARAVLLAGLAGLVFANLVFQILAAHPVAPAGIGSWPPTASWTSLAYTMASFVGVVTVPSLVRKLGLRQYFAFSAALFALLACLIATVPSAPLMFAVRLFEGFTLGGSGPRALLAAFILYRTRQAPPAITHSAFLLLVMALIGLALLGTSEKMLGWRGMFLLQAGWSIAVAVGGLCWLPRTPTVATELPVGRESTGLARSTLALAPRTRRRSHRRSTSPAAIHGPGALPWRLPARTFPGVCHVNAASATAAPASPASAATGTTHYAER